MKMRLGNRFLGSLRAQVLQEVAQHRLANPALRSQKYRWPLRLLRLWFNAETLYQPLLVYCCIVIVVLVLEVVVKLTIPAEVLDAVKLSEIDAYLRDVNSYLLATQATAIGVIFPISVSLVTLIVQRDEGRSANSDIQIYYGEALAFSIGASSLALLIAMAIQIVWPANFLLQLLGYGTPFSFFKVALTLIHIAWLVINLIALWHLIVTSLSFIHPPARERMRIRFAANNSIPADLFRHLIEARYISMANYGGASNRNQNPHVRTQFGFAISGGVPEVEMNLQTEHVLFDVWQVPLHWAIRRWERRILALKLPNVSPFPANETLSFEPVLGSRVRGEICICRRLGSMPLTRFERHVVATCFRFKRARQ